MAQDNATNSALEGGTAIRLWWRIVFSSVILALAAVSNSMVWFSFPGVPTYLRLAGGRVMVRSVAFYAPALLATVLVAGGLLISCILVVVGTLWTLGPHKSRRSAPETGPAGEFGRSGRRVRLTATSAADVIFCLIFSGAAVTLLWENRSGIPGWMLVALFVQDTFGLLALAGPWIAPEGHLSGGSVAILPQPRSRLEWALAMLAFAGTGASAAVMLVVTLALASRQPPWHRLVILGSRPASRGVLIVVGGESPATTLQGLVVPGLANMGALAAALGAAAAICWIFCGWPDRRGAASEDVASSLSVPCERSRVVTLLLWVGTALSLAVEVVVLFEQRFYWGMEMGHSLAPIIFGQVLASALVLLARPLGIVTVCRSTVAGLRRNPIAFR